MEDFYILYTKVCKLHNRLFNTYLEVWEDERALHHIRLANGKEISEIIIEMAYEEAYKYLLTLNAYIEVFNENNIRADEN